MISAHVALSLWEKLFNLQANTDLTGLISPHKAYEISKSVGRLDSNRGIVDNSSYLLSHSGSLTLLGPLYASHKTEKIRY